MCVCVTSPPTWQPWAAELVEQGSRGLPSPGHHTHTSDLSSYCMLAPAGNLVLIRHVASLARLESSSCLMFASPHSRQIAVNICGDLESEDQMERTRYCPVTHLSHLMLSTSNGEFRNYFSSRIRGAMLGRWWPWHHRGDHSVTVLASAGGHPPHCRSYQIICHVFASKIFSDKYYCI